MHGKLTSANCSGSRSGCKTFRRACGWLFSRGRWLAWGGFGRFIPFRVIFLMHAAREPFSFDRAVSKHVIREGVNTISHALISAPVADLLRVLMRNFRGDWIRGPQNKDRFRRGDPCWLVWNAGGCLWY
jgi:hypothetical protein